MSSANARMPLDPVTLKTLALELNAALPPLPSRESAALMTQAVEEIENCTERLGALLDVIQTSALSDTPIGDSTLPTLCDIGADYVKRIASATKELDI